VLLLQSKAIFCLTLLEKGGIESVFGMKSDSKSGKNFLELFKIRLNIAKPLRTQEKGCILKALNEIKLFVKPNRRN